MKDIPYITHDFGARNDPKLIELQMEMGGQGLAIFWCLVEMLWENDGEIPANFKSIAFALRWCKPAEVEKVVNNFGLFQVRDGRITSSSATARITEMRDRFNVRSESGRKASNARWGKGANANAMRTDSERNADALQTDSERKADAMPLTNLLTNLLTNKLTKINNTPLTAADIFVVLFFRNLKDPYGELQRFMEYYEARGWTYQDGTPVSDPGRAAEDWKPKYTGKRFSDEALRWYRAVWNAARPRMNVPIETFLLSLDALTISGQHITLRYRTDQAGRTAAGFILDNDLAGDYKLDFRVSN